MNKIIILFLFSFNLFSFHSFAQTDSCGLQISLLTCSPGEELYATFGHTALRVRDSINDLDIIFNYGTFEFSPDFYKKFIKGRLLYFLSVENFDDFVHQYQYESRSIVQQLLSLNCLEKQKLFSALKINAREENKFYRYDFLFDNCTTRAKDIVANNTDSPVIFHNILPQHLPTFRKLIHSYLDIGGQYWSWLGIDILLGMKVDRKVTNEQAMFLPDYLMKGFDSAYVSGRPLVNRPEPILEMPSSLNKRSLFRPGIVFSVLLFIIIIFTFNKSSWATVTIRTFDHIFFLFLGLTGLLILFMWFETDHAVCRNNLNLSWAIPFHLPMAFVLHQKRKWIRAYFLFIFWLGILLILTWFILPQQLNNSLIPIILLIILRSLQLSKRYPDGKKTN